MNKYKKAILNSFKQFYKIIPDMLAIAGAISISYGCYTLNKSLGFIVFGFLLVGGAVIWSKS